MEEKEGLLMYLPHELRQDFHYLSLRSSLLEEISLLYGRPLAAGVVDLNIINVVVSVYLTNHKIHILTRFT